MPILRQVGHQSKFANLVKFNFILRRFNLIVRNVCIRSNNSRAGYCLDRIIIVAYSKNWSIGLALLRKGMSASSASSTGRNAIPFIINDVSSRSASSGPCSYTGIGSDIATSTRARTGNRFTIHLQRTTGHNMSTISKAYDNRSTILTGIDVLDLLFSTISTINFNSRRRTALKRPCELRLQQLKSGNACILVKHPCSRSTFGNRSDIRMASSDIRNRTRRYRRARNHNSARRIRRRRIRRRRRTYIARNRRRRINYSAGIAGRRKARIYRTRRPHSPPR